MKITINLYAGRNRLDLPTKNIMDRNIRAVERAIDGKLLAVDSTYLIDTLMILEVIKKELPDGRLGVDERICIKGIKPTITHAEERSGGLCYDDLGGYEFGQHVCFIDDKIREISGVVIFKQDFPDFLVLRIRLDNGLGLYDAKLRKRKKEK